MALCVIGTVTAARAVFVNTGHLQAINLWSALPLGAAAVSGVQIIRGGPSWTVWVPVGTLCAFVVFAMWSLGLFYAHGALAFLAAAIVHLAWLGAWRQIPLVCLWFAAGASGLSLVFLASDWIRALTAGVAVSHAEAVVFGSWIFCGVAAALIAREIVVFVLRRRVAGTR
jgi:hypothetical protein